MRTMRPVEVVKAFPFIQFSFKINYPFVAKQLVKFLSIRSMRPLHFAVQLRRTTFDVGVPDAKIFDMPMEFSLKLMAVVGSDLSDTERKLIDDVINEVNGIGLGVFLVDF